MHEVRNRWRLWTPTRKDAVGVATEPTELVFGGFDGNGRTDVPEKKPTLADLPPDAKGIPYEKWKAEALNDLFREHTGISGHITEGDIRKSELATQRWEAARRADLNANEPDIKNSRDQKEQK